MVILVSNHFNQNFNSKLNRKILIQILNYYYYYLINLKINTATTNGNNNGNGKNHHHLHHYTADNPLNSNDFWEEKYSRIAVITPSLAAAATTQQLSKI